LLVEIDEETRRLGERETGGKGDWGKGRLGERETGGKGVLKD